MLQGVRLQALYPPLDSPVSATLSPSASTAFYIAFFLNIYNTLMIHALCTWGAPKSMRERLAIYSKAAYEIGGYFFTLDDIEHGILRGNTASPGSVKGICCARRRPRHFAATDVRRRFALRPNSVDPRIHFALNCGAVSCPAIRVYSGHNLDTALTVAVKSFLEDPANFLVLAPTDIIDNDGAEPCDSKAVNIVPSVASASTDACPATLRHRSPRLEHSLEKQRRKVTILHLSLSKIFQWYSSDFGTGNVALLRWLVPYVPLDAKELCLRALEEHWALRFTFAPYNWAINDGLSSSSSQQ